MKPALFTSAVLVFAIMATTPLTAQIKAPGVEKDMVAATVNGSKIMESEIKAFYSNLPGQYKKIPLNQLRGQLLNKLIEQLVVEEAARQAGIDKRLSVQRRIASVTRRIVNEPYINEKIGERVTEKAIRNKYQQSIALERKRQEVRARHILVKSKSQALQIIKQLQAGANFANLAKSRSTGPSGRNGGDLGYFEYKQMVPPFSKAAFALKPGDITVEPVQTRFGWHVIKVEDRRVSGNESYEQAAKKIRQELTEKVYQETINRLKAKARIKISGAVPSKIRRIQ